MTLTEKAAYAGQNTRAVAHGKPSTLTTVIRMNDKVEEMAGLMKEQHRRRDELQGPVIRLEMVLELALQPRNHPPGLDCHPHLIHRPG